MITESNIELLQHIVAEYAKCDMQNANPNPKMYNNGKTNYIPYILSVRTNEAREILNIALKENISLEEEEKVKAYILRYKLLS